MVSTSQVVNQGMGEAFSTQPSYHIILFIRFIPFNKKPYGLERASHHAFCTGISGDNSSSARGYGGFSTSASILQLPVADKQPAMSGPIHSLGLAQPDVVYIQLALTAGLGIVTIA